MDKSKRNSYKFKSTYSDLVIEESDLTRCVVKLLLEVLAKNDEKKLFMQENINNSDYKNQINTEDKTKC